MKVLVFESNESGLAQRNLPLAAGQACRNLSWLLTSNKKNPGSNNPGQFINQPLYIIVAENICYSKKF